MVTNKIAVAARAGYAARGVVYLIIGSLALLAAFGSGGGTTDSKGAMRELLSQPFGNILLAILGLGFVGYSIWRFIQAVFDADDHGTDGKGLLIRAGLLISAMVHIGLAVYALDTALGWVLSSGSGGNSSTEDWTAWLLSKPFGQWLVGALGLVVIGVGIAHAVKALKTTFEKRLLMNEEQLKWASPICIFGLFARGIAFTIIGGFLVIAAIQSRPEKARGLDGALQALQEQPYGPYLLGVVALGLVAFALYSLIEAYYRRIDQP